MQDIVKDNIHDVERLERLFLYLEPLREYYQLFRDAGVPIPRSWLWRVPLEKEDINSFDRLAIGNEFQKVISRKDPIVSGILDQGRVSLKTYTILIMRLLTPNKDDVYRILHDYPASRERDQTYAAALHRLYDGEDRIKESDLLLSWNTPISMHRYNAIKDMMADPAHNQLHDLDTSNGIYVAYGYDGMIGPAYRELPMGEDRLLEVVRKYAYMPGTISNRLSTDHVMALMDHTNIMRAMLVHTNLSIEDAVAKY